MLIVSTHISKNKFYSSKRAKKPTSNPAFSLLEIILRILLGIYFSKTTLDICVLPSDDNLTRYTPAGCSVASQVNECSPTETFP